MGRPPVPRQRWNPDTGGWEDPVESDEDRRARLHREDTERREREWEQYQREREQRTTGPYL